MMIIKDTIRGKRQKLIEQSNATMVSCARNSIKALAITFMITNNMMAINCWQSRASQQNFTNLKILNHNISMKRKGLIIKRDLPLPYNHSIMLQSNTNLLKLLVVVVQ